MAEITKAKSLGDWFNQRLGTDKLIKVMMTEYWVPKNLNFLWAMGVTITVMLLLLIVSGMMLLCYYKPDTALAFDSVNYTIMQEVSFGWLWRHVHAVAASFVFLIIYIHMFTGIYYGSYKSGREMIWLTGMLLFVCFSAEAFSGYMLPWGQMSYWAATVITNLFGAIPVIGESLVLWIRGDYVVSDATLNRFFMLHVFLLPVVIMALIAVHFYSLRTPHVNSQDGEHIDFEAEAKKFQAGQKKESKVIPFWPAFLSKDIFVVLCILVLFFYLVCYHFEFALDPVNFDPANNLKTPKHIYPEWYFLWSYEVLRGFFFSGGLGLIGFAIANGILLFMPWLDRNPNVAPASKFPKVYVWFWILIIDLICLTILGKLPPEGPIKYVGFAFTIVFFLLFISLPFISKTYKKDA